MRGRKRIRKQRYKVMLHKVDLLRQKSDCGLSVMLPIPRRDLDMTSALFLAQGKRENKRR